MRGGYNEKTNVLAINFAHHGNDQKLKETIIHELQHYIQGREDFARGSSIDREARILREREMRSGQKGTERGASQEMGERSGQVVLTEEELYKLAKRNYERQYGEMEAYAVQDRR